MAHHPVARVTDIGSHGGPYTTGSPDSFANGLQILRLGDIYGCAVHGPNPMVTASGTVKANGIGVCRNTDQSACGAHPVTFSPNVNAGD